jgi:N-acetylated-alpha-linked acidic dipeptidase
MKVVLDDKVRPIQTVIGRIRGSSAPEDEVILGNHRDAWLYGGVDPSSGTASMMDLARSLGALSRAGVRPKRTIVFASWDAEEFTLTSSTEWGEQNEADLREHAIAYLNVDSSTSGPTFTASAVPSLNQLISEVAGSILDPKTGLSVAEAKRKDGNRQTSGLPNAAGTALVSNRLGSGSDYTVFLNFIGVPVVDMAFDGAYGVYHSQYDDHLWVSRIGDPGFKYHEAMTKLWGVMALRLANADALPLDYRPYASTVGDFAKELEAAWTPDAGVAFEPLRAAVNRFVEAADIASSAQSAALVSGDVFQLTAINQRLMRAERGLLDPDGIPGRPWYRHQIYAPKYTYAPDLLPALNEAIDAGDAAAVSAAVTKISAALDRASMALTQTATH